MTMYTARSLGLAILLVSSASICRADEISELKARMVELEKRVEALEKASTQSPVKPSAISMPPVGTTPAARPSAAWRPLQGKWKVVRVEKGKGADQAWGRILQWWGWGRGDWDADPSNTYRFEFHDRDAGSLVIHSRLPQTLIIQFRIDPRATPKTIDFYGLDSYRPGTDGRVGLGIYEIEPNRLRICLTGNMPGFQGKAQRPTGFSVSRDSANILFVLEPYTPPPELQTVAGTWEIVTHIKDGEAVSHAGPPIFRRWTFFGDLVTMNDERSGRFVLNATTQPKQITWAGWEGVNEKITEQHFNGIYKLDGDRLTIAYRQDGPRPEKFESPHGSGVTLLELERPKPTASPKPDDAKTGKSQVPPRPAKTPIMADGKAKK